MAPPTVHPEAFTRAVAGLRAADPRPEILLEEIAAPQRLAPYAFALSATVLRDDDEVATGRLILLHDPAGHEAWQGTLRLVTLVTAELESTWPADPLLPAVGWTWLTDALDAQDAGYTRDRRHGHADHVDPVRRAGRARRHRRPRDPRLLDPDRRRPRRAPAGLVRVLLASTAGLPPPGVTALPARRRPDASSRARAQQILNSRQAVLIGTARPMPSASRALAVARPTTCLAELTTGPPELPGLIGASNWIIGDWASSSCGRR